MGDGYQTAVQYGLNIYIVFAVPAGKKESV